MGLFDFLSGSGAPYQLYNPEEFAAREQDINQFSNHLDTLSQQYKDSLKNFYGTAFSLGSTDLAANFGGANLNLNGGAFQSALARLASGYTAQMLPQAYSQDINNANTIFGARTNLFNTRLGAGAQQNELNTNYRLGNEAALGQLFLRAGAGAAMGGMGGGGWSGAGTGAVAGAAGYNPLSLRRDSLFGGIY